VAQDKTQIDLFNDVERRAKNLALSGVVHPFDWHNTIIGLLNKEEIEVARLNLGKLSVDDYVEQVLDPAESAQRPSAKSIISQLKGKIHSEFELGPLYTTEICLKYGETERRIGIIAPYCQRIC